MRKIRLLPVIAALLALLLMCLASCGSSIDAPENLRLDSDTQTLHWDRVPGALGYSVLIGEKEKTTRTNSFSLESLEPGDYEIKVKSLGDGEVLADSEYKSFSFTRETETGLQYKLINNNTEYELAGVGVALGDVVMEEYYRGKPVTSIAKGALASNEVITSFTINSKVTEIPQKMFYNCKALTKVVIPDNIKSIGANAFQSCRELVEIRMPQGVTEIADYTFSYCRALTKVEMGDNVTRIGSFAFSDCSALKGVTMPNTVTYIGEYAFSGCESAETISISNNVETIGKYAFYNCKLVTEFSLGDKLRLLGDSAFESCLGITEISFPSSIESIGGRCFAFCANLASINLPDDNNVSFIGRNLVLDTEFYNASPDDELVYLGNWILTSKDPKISEGQGLGKLIKSGTVGVAYAAFYGCNGFTDVYLPDVKYICDYAFFKCTNLMDVKVGKYGEIIGAYAFSGCTNLNNAIISSSKIKDIGKFAFAGCKKLKQIDLPNTVEHIGARAFQDTALAISVDGVMYADNWAVGAAHLFVNNIMLKDDTVGIADYTFSQCVYIGPVTMPDSIKTIGRGAFLLCSTLSIEKLPENLTKIDDYAFYACNNGKFGADYHLYLPEGLETIGRSAFYQSAVMGLTIPASVKSIDDYAFYGCPLLGGEVEFLVGTEEDGTPIVEVESFYVYIEEGVESIGERAFAACARLTEVTLPDSVTDLGYRAFYKCEALKNFNAGEGLTKIADQTFYDCVALEKVTLTNSITEIGKYAFRGCKALKSVNLGNSLTNIDNFAFSGCESLKTIKLPASLTRVGEFAFRGCKGLSSIVFHGTIAEMEQHAVYGCSELTIYVEGNRDTLEWNDYWNSVYRPVVWDCGLSEDATYVVSFNKNEYSFDNTDALNGISEPYRMGYDFLGWSTIEDGAVEYTTTTELISAPNGIYYAIWD